MCLERHKNDYHFLHHIPSFHSDEEAVKWFEQYGRVIQTHFISTSAEDIYFYDFYSNGTDQPISLEIAKSGYVQVVHWH